MPSGWGGTTFFPGRQQCDEPLTGNHLSGSPFGVTWRPSYLPWRNGYEGFQYRDDLHWTKGRHQFKFGAGVLHDYKNQQLQANTQGTAIYQQQYIFNDPYINFMLGMPASFQQLEYLADKHWVNNNYNLTASTIGISPETGLNLGMRYDGLPHAFERYNQFANFVTASTTPRWVIPYSVGWNAQLCQLSTFSATGSGEQFYLNGIEEAGVTASRAVT